jgi:hyperosmotically inducible protein
MRSKIAFIHLLILLTPALALGLPLQDRPLPQQDRLESPADRDLRRLESLKEEVRHRLVMLPYYNVFDWLEANVRPDGTVTLNGQVTRPSTKDDAEHRVKNLEGATAVINNIEVLPPSSMDDQIRLAVYRAIFKYDSPLFRYSTQSVPPIHIIVKNARVWLKGVVATPMDSQLAGVAARGVSGILDVHNELQIEGSTSVEVSERLEN